jgi:hypothetical protein
METVTRNEAYTDGFVAALSGLFITANPYGRDTFEGMSWCAGWHKGRLHYLDEGWVVA